MQNTARGPDRLHDQRVVEHMSLAVEEELIEAAPDVEVSRRRFPAYLDRASEGLISAHCKDALLEDDLSVPL